MDQASKKTGCAIEAAGGVTRLTHTGISVVEWQPLTGTLPPLTGIFAGTLIPLTTPELRRINGTL
ncbi:MAG: COX15/CtaA family protein [Betaproteobacteria bacterium]|nr:COX15/CtaA family protein [Betaproteobacteria bacterium]